MTTIFVFCAVVGGTILVCQFVLTLIGFGHDLGADGLDHDLPADVHAVVGHDAAHDASHTHGDQAHGSSWLFGVISFRTLVAAFAFFGLAGLAAQSAGLSSLAQVAISLGSGVAAMFGVHFVMKQLGRLGQDATVRISKAIGQSATVYVPIPAGKSDVGKVQLTLQNRLVEYAAVTSGEKLPTGAKVRVVAVRGNTLEVEPLPKEALAAK